VRHPLAREDVFVKGKAFWAPMSGAVGRESAVVESAIHHRIGDQKNKQRKRMERSGG
jgi:hypothetical protein